MKPRIVYNKHPLEVPARELALELRKEYRGRVLFTEFDHEKVARGIKLPSSDMDDFVDEYLSFLGGACATPGSHLDTLYLFFRKHPELLLIIDTLHETKASPDKYLQFVKHFSDLWINECENGVVTDYLAKITKYFKRLVRKRICLDFHNTRLGTVPSEFFDRSMGEVLIMMRGRNKKLENLISGLHFQKKHLFWYTVVNFRPSSLNPPTHVLEFFENWKPPKIPKRSFEKFIVSLTENKEVLSSMNSISPMLFPDIYRLGTYKKSRYFDDYLNWSRALLDELIKL